MKLQTIRQVSQDYGVSRQMLYYYEEMGLIKSSRKSDYAYRVYDENEIKRLQQIIILRKLQIPIRQIKDILNNQHAVAVIEIFEQNINELDQKISALSTLRLIMRRFVDEMKEKANIQLELDLLNDKTLQDIVGTLSFPENKIEEKVSMDELFLASETLEKLEEKKNAETIGPVETAIKNAPQSNAKFKFSVEKCGPYRFIGKSVYFRNDWGSPYSIAGDICKNLWKAKDWIFSILDTMTEYHTDMPYAGGIYMWDRYDEKNQQQGYIIGKFMKANTPVPDGMDYFDIPEGYIAKGWGGYVENEVKAMLKNSNKYADASWNWSSEVFTDPNFVNQDDTKGYFISATLREQNIDNRQAMMKAEMLEREKSLTPLLVELGKAFDNTKTEIIDLTTMDKQGDLHLSYDNGIMTMTAQGDRNVMATVQKFNTPLKIELRAKTNGSNIRLRYCCCELMFNWEINYDALGVVDKNNDKGYGYGHNGRIPINEFVDIEWLIGSEVMTVKVNGEYRFISNDSFVKKINENHQPQPVCVFPAWGSTVTVESLCISEIKHTLVEVRD